MAPHHHQPRALGKPCPRLREHLPPPAWMELPGPEPVATAWGGCWGVGAAAGRSGRFWRVAVLEDILVRLQSSGGNQRKRLWPVSRCCPDLPGSTVHSLAHSANVLRAYEVPGHALGTRALPETSPHGSLWSRIPGQEASVEDEPWEQPGVGDACRTRDARLGKRRQGPQWLQSQNHSGSSQGNVLRAPNALSSPVLCHVNRSFLTDLTLRPGRFHIRSLWVRRKIQPPPAGGRRPGGLVKTRLGARPAHTWASGPRSACPPARLTLVTPTFLPACPAHQGHSPALSEAWSQALDGWRGRTVAMATERWPQARSQAE